MVDAEEEMKLLETVEGLVTPKQNQEEVDETADPPRLGGEIPEAGVVDAERTDA